MLESAKAGLSKLVKQKISAYFFIIFTIIQNLVKINEIRIFFYEFRQLLLFTELIKNVIILASEGILYAVFPRNRGFLYTITSGEFL